MVDEMAIPLILTIMKSKASRISLTQARARVRADPRLDLRDLSLVGMIDLPTDQTDLLLKNGQITLARLT